MNISVRSATSLQVSKTRLEIAPQFSPKKTRLYQVRSALRSIHSARASVAKVKQGLMDSGMEDMGVGVGVGVGTIRSVGGGDSNLHMS
jgi:hypothetical protein